MSGARTEAPIGSAAWWDDLMLHLEAWRAESALAEPSVTALALTTGRDPWTILASTLLSLRTKDAVTLSAAGRLLARAPTPAALLELSAVEIETLIFPVGFYKTKARTLRSAAALILEKFGGQVPDDQATLLALPGVGLKTANLVLSEAFDQDAICVDTHVHRIANRLGAVRTANADATEAALRASLPLVHWKRINALLVLYGQNVCRPVGPRCRECGVRELCGRVGLA